MELYSAGKMFSEETLWGPSGVRRVTSLSSLPPAPPLGTSIIFLLLPAKTLSLAGRRRLHKSRRLRREWNKKLWIHLVSLVLFLEFSSPVGGGTEGGAAMSRNEEHALDLDGDSSGDFVSPSSGRVPRKKVPSSSDGGKTRSRKEDDDGGCFRLISSFSINKIRNVLGSFVGQKKQLLESIGFGGLLSIHRKNMISRRLAFWLLRNMDNASSSIVLRDGVKIQIKDVDVNLMLGLPHELDGAGRQQLSISRAAEIVKITLGLGKHADIRMDYIESLLMKDYCGKMSTKEKSAFKVALVLFVDAHFLAPKSYPAKVNYGLLPYLVDPDLIQRVNWSAYLLKVVKEASIKVFYLDNLDTGSNVGNNRKLPRVSDYPYEKIKNLLSQDKDTSNDGISLHFGKTKDAAEYVMSKFMEFKEQLDEYKRVYVDQIEVCEKFEAIDLCTPDINLMKPSDLCTSPSVRSYGVYSAGPTFDESAVRESGERFQSSDGSYIMQSGTLLNVEEHVVSGSDGTNCKQFPDSPFSLLLEDPTFPKRAVLSLKKEIENLCEDDLDRYWFVHNTPTNISLSGRSFREEFTCIAEWTVSVVDAICRLWMHLDDIMYDGHNGKRWRHFLPSSWSEVILHGQEIRWIEDTDAMFRSSDIRYNVEDCRMERVLTVIDPKRMVHDKDYVKFKHHFTVEKLHRGLAKCLGSIGNDWATNYLAVEGANCERCLTQLIPRELIPFTRLKYLYQMLAMEGNADWKTISSPLFIPFGCSLSTISEASFKPSKEPLTTPRHISTKSFSSSPPKGDTGREPFGIPNAFCTLGPDRGTSTLSLSSKVDISTSNLFKSQSENLLLTLFSCGTCRMPPNPMS
ncbi:hypothetical protein EJB05_51760, partial [Eragrostis curvula]